MLRRFLTRTTVPIALAILMIACGGGDSSDPTATATFAAISTTPDPTATPEPDAASPYSLPTRDVSFAVTLPANTAGPVWVRVFGVTQWEFARSIELAEGDGNVWTASVPLEDGALVRYAYDRGDLDDIESLTARREAPAIGLETVWRVVNVAPELTEVRDTVAMWADAPASTPSGTVTGVVTDAVSGEPVIDAEISVGGMHTATDFDGGFRLDGVAAGDQIVTVHRATGDYLAASEPVTVRADSEVTQRFEAMPARRITVQIQAILPEDMPLGAAVKVYGNVWQTGASFDTAPGEPDGLLLPVAHDVRGREGERVQIALDLYEGQALSYRYTLAGPGLSTEVRLDGDQTPRSFIASRQTRSRIDQIETFRPADMVEVVLRAQVPDNMPADVPVQAVIGSGYWMTDNGNGSWSTVLYGRPGEVLSYALRLGDSVAAGADASTDAVNGIRTLEVPEADTAFGIQVTDWVGRAGVALLPDGGLSEVRFRVSVPALTTDAATTLRLIGNGDLKEGIELTRVAGDVTLYEGVAMLPSGHYVYQVWRENPDLEPAAAASDRELEVRLVEHVVNDWVAGWAGDIPNVRPREVRFVGGYYLPDFWSPGQLALTKSTVESLENRGDVPVVLSSVWSYGQVRPEPVVEARARYAGSVATPLEALIDQAAEARRSGLPVILAPQFNMEMTPDGDSLAGPKSQAWLDAWLVEAERLWLWNAEVAHEINADLLLLPGPTFHVFDQRGWFPSTQSFEEFDAELIDLIAEVRERYDGRIILSGGETGLEAPGAADAVGVTTFDIGHPALGPSATVAQWAQAYDAQFAARLDPIHETWELPVFIYQLHVPSVSSAIDPTGEYVQARQLEGLLQALSQRTWVVGTLAWNYDMIEAPEMATDGFRGRLADAVLAKHNELFNPGDVAALTVG